MRQTLPILAFVASQFLGAHQGGLARQYASWKRSYKRSLEVLIEGS